MDNTPFFIIGAPRSGTTLLRDILKQHQRLEAPEETHFFRWSEAFGSNGYLKHYRKSPLFTKHRSIDGVHDRDFFLELALKKDRKKLMDWYGERILSIKNNPSGRWFDKTPQNVYGILLISEMYPDSKFVHIYRNPLNVVASLVEGKVMPKQNLNAAINAWVEPMAILAQYKKIANQRLLEVCYESLGENCRDEIYQILTFLGENSEQMNFTIAAHKEKNRYKKILTEEEIYIVLDATEKYRLIYGY